MDKRNNIDYTPQASGNRRPNPAAGRRGANRLTAEQRKKRNKRRVIMLIVELVLLLILVGIVWFNSDHNPLNHIERTDPLAPKTELVNNDIDEDTAQVLEGYTDIAIFGVDNRSNGDTDSGNSDVIMVASINKDTKKIKLISVYRDTFLDTDVGYSTGINFHKVNRAYAYGGHEQAVKVLNANLDLDIEHFVTVDFRAVTDLVDAVGGVDIDIDSAELKWMTEYITGTAAVTGKTSALVYDTGLQHLNGTQATAYCRIRYTAGNDYKRTERQREVLDQVFKKIKKMDNPTETINTIVDKVFPEISTDMNNMEIISLAFDAMNCELDGTAGFPFNKYATDFGGSKGDVVCAADWKINVEALHKFLYNNDNYTPSDTVLTYNRLLTENYGCTVEKGDEATKFLEQGIQLDEFN